MKRSKWLILCVAMLTLLSACGGGTNDKKSTSDSSTPPAKDSTGKEVRITVSTNIVGEQAKVLQEITDNFMKENPSIKVDFSAPGKEYENTMKVKMASNDMPDVFSTHGWAKARYGEFLLDLSGESWASSVNAAIKPLVTDESGKLYVLPMDQDKSGPVYNVSLLEKYDVKVPTTYEEFLTACETIKTKSNGEVIPIHIGGADSWPIGQYFDFFATPLLISSSSQDFGNQLRDGSFDWTKFEQLPQMFKDLQTKGYLNKDVLTAKYSDSAKAFAEGKAAFGIYGPYFIEEAQKINPDLKAGLMPIPSIVSGDTPTFAGGERTTWGIWKDSKNIDAAKKYVEYFAKPENAALVAKSNQLPPGIDGAQMDVGQLTEYFEQYKDIRVFPFFDREYIPNGMWDVMCKNGQDILADGIDAKGYTANMKQEYERLRAAN
jgi:raffinose/stachyose/melibiose transport system substrate-binding protein